MNQENNAPQLSENEIIQKKKEKIATLKNEGIHPYANCYKPQNYINEVIDFCKKSSKEDLEKTGKEERFSIAGRIMLLRVMGKLAFANIKDETGTLQVVFAKDFMGEEFSRFKKSFDVGDIVWIKGEPFVTRTGEFSILSHDARLLTKNIRPLPEKFHGLTDKETRYRQRYLDLIMNDDVKETFRKRTKIVSYVRNYMEKEGFLEVETPMMHPLVSGAAAKPFITHHNTLDVDLYMRIAPECYLKRLLVGGMGKVYELNRNFRNEGMGIKHNPEFTMMEFYWPYATYQDLIEFTQKMISELVEKVCGSLKVTYQGKEIDFSMPWKRMTIEESLINENICTLEQLSDREKLLEIAVSKGIERDSLKDLSIFKIIIELFEHCVEEKLWNPVFITNYPTEVSPLSRRNDENPEYCDRFELFMAGREIANAFSELNDPVQQYEAFLSQVEAKNAGDEEAIDMDYDYIRALEYGMPPAAGEGIGIDRLVMLLTDSASIRDVIFFPQMRTEN